MAGEMYYQFRCIPPLAPPLPGSWCKGFLLFSQDSLPAFAAGQELLLFVTIPEILTSPLAFRPRLRYAYGQREAGQ